MPVHTERRRPASRPHPRRLTDTRVVLVDPQRHRRQQVLGVRQRRHRQHPTPPRHPKVRQTLASPPGRRTPRRSRRPRSRGRGRPCDHGSGAARAATARRPRRRSRALAGCGAVSGSTVCAVAVCGRSTHGETTSRPDGSRSVYAASPKRPAEPDAWVSSATPRSRNARSAAAAVPGSMRRCSATSRAELGATQRPSTHSASKTRS